MFILAPADNAAEVSTLAKAGASALYFGYQPPSMDMAEYGRRSFNRRTFREAQVSSLDEIKAMVSAAEKAGARLAATFNAASYAADMYDPVVAAVKRLRDIGVAEFIVADIPLILRLREEGINNLTLSTVAGAVNAEAVAFFRRLGIRRFTLPRELTVAQIIAIARSRPDEEFHVFILFGACGNSEPFCRWRHDDPGRVWPCVKRYAVRTAPAGDGAVSRAIAARQGWFDLPRAWACGLCALAGLSAAPNVTALKIVGRGAASARKIAGVSMLREAMSALADEAPEKRFYDAAKEIKRRYSGLGCHPYLCYFPEYL